MKNTHPKHAYSVRAICDAYDIGRTKFYELVKAGEIKTSKIGAKTIVTEEERQRFSERLNKSAVA